MKMTLEEQVNEIWILNKFIAKEIMKIIDEIWIFIQYKAGRDPEQMTDLSD